MKKLSAFPAVLLSATCYLLFAIFFPAYASTQTFVLGKNEVIDSDYLKANDSLIINGKVKGDAFLVAGLVDVNGDIDGDLFIFGGKINVNGRIGQSLRVLGGDVSLNGGVGRNVAILGGNVSINKSASVAGSLLSVAGNLSVNSPKIEKGIRFFGARMFLNSFVSKDVFAVANQELILGPEASIAGNLKYTGSKEAVIEKGATVSGRVLFEPETKENGFPSFFQTRRFLDAYSRIKPLVLISDLLVSLFVGYVLINLFPKIFEKVTVAITKEPFASLGWGTIGGLLFLLAIILLTLTIVGIPIAILLGLSFFLISFMAKLFASFFIGRQILVNFVGDRRGWALSLGLVIFYLLNFIPVLGRFIQMVLTLVALGALVLSYRQPTLFKGTPLWQEIHKEK